MGIRSFIRSCRAALRMGVSEHEASPHTRSLSIQYLAKQTAPLAAKVSLVIAKGNILQGRGSAWAPDSFLPSISQPTQLLPSVSEKHKGWVAESTSQPDKESVETTESPAFSPKDETELFELCNASAASPETALEKRQVTISLEVAFPLYDILEEPELESDSGCDSKYHQLEEFKFSASSSNRLQGDSGSNVLILSEQYAKGAHDPDCDDQQDHGNDSENDDDDYDSEDEDYDYTFTPSHTGLEYTSWAQTSFIDHEGRLNLYSMTSGTLSCCNWGWYPDHNYPPPMPEGSTAPCLVLTVVEGDHYFLDDPFEVNGTYAENDRRLEELRAMEEAAFLQSQAQQFGLGPPTNKAMIDEPLEDVTKNTPATSVEVDSAFSGYSFNAAAGIMWADDEDDWDEAGDASPNQDSEHDYDGESDSGSCSIHYSTWTGLEFTPWATHSYIDPDGHMDLYSLRQVREAELYAHGALPRCDWWHWDDPDQYPESDGPALVLSTAEGDEYELDDPKEYDGSYQVENQPDQSGRETEGDAGSETGYAFDAAKGIMWADDEAEDDYWERVEGQGEEWWD
ncbi:hypothetical protein B0T21DRAFT_412589 [Apiosordaria backusii]|uniref:Uncharacterized protein n=1 Tax=Apiosordaria backusii TaxID=314023 RepID=A0AA40ECJ0_9PEZI|nr:hypothetical protein B0T21DRAFT_412589 [Apiosordaria backusii]